MHPGPAAPGSWLPALTDYVGGLASAWFAWAVHGRAAHPELRVCFAALGGLAPLHLERLAARGHPHDAALAVNDGLTFHDTSSYGPVAIEAVARALGPGSLCWMPGHDTGTTTTARPARSPCSRAPSARSDCRAELSAGCD